MISARELAWLHALQIDLSIKRNWVAVGHLQALIDHLSDECGFSIEDSRPYDQFMIH